MALTAAEKKHREHLRRSKTPQRFDTCPVSPILHHVLTDCREHGLHFAVISADRRDGIAQKFGHQSQQELWDLYQSGHGNPANPPGHSTHEYKDGPGPYPYPPIPDGKALKPWMLGLDLASNDQASYFCQAAAHLGYAFYQPYNSASELHHVNLREDPLPNLIKRGRVQ